MTATGTTPAATVRRARASDLPNVHRLVEDNGLDSDGLDDAVRFVAETAGTIDGTVALEQHGSGADTAFPTEQSSSSQ